MILKFKGIVRELEWDADDYPLERYPDSIADEPVNVLDD